MKNAITIYIQLDPLTIQFLIITHQLTVQKMYKKERKNSSIKTKNKNVSKLENFAALDKIG